MIGDHESAIQLAYKIHERFPDSQEAYQSLLSALATSKDDRPLLDAWQAYYKRYGDSTAAFEQVAWGVLKSGYASGNDIPRLYSLIGASLSRDIRGVEYLKGGMRSSSAVVRNAAIQLAAKMRDEALKEEICRILREERIWHVRLEAIKAAGRMQIESSWSTIQKILQDSMSTAEEKRASMTALVEMTEKAERPDLEQLVKSPRVGLRQLACALIAHFESVENIDLLMQLSKDRQAEVRRSALLAFGRLADQPVAFETIKNTVTEASLDPDEETALASGWLEVVYQSENSAQRFERWLNHPSQHLQRVAAGSVSAMGSAGVKIAENYFKTHPDTFVRLNLSIALLQQRSSIEEASKQIVQIMASETQRLSTFEGSVFSFIGPSSCRHRPEIPAYPDTVDSLTRLGLLNLLSIVKSPDVEKGIQSFLKERKWGVSGTAALSLLAEGGDSALESVRSLLKAEQGQVRVQAALVLALWGKDEEALGVLESSYHDADRQLKEQILQGVAAVGSERSLPFLNEVLKEPFQTLRILAASAVIQCINN